MGSLEAINQAKTRKNLTDYRAFGHGAPARFTFQFLVKFELKFRKPSSS